MARKTKNDWYRAGFTMLRQGGLDGLTIEKLCGELSVTKGSFYHHFEGLRDYQNQLLGHWESQYTLLIIEEAETAPTPIEIMDRIVESVLEPTIFDPPEEAIRIWAYRDEIAKSYVQRVDEKRLAYGLQLMMQATGKGIKEAQPMIELLYSLLIGSTQLFPDRTRARVIYQEFKRLYGLV